MTVDTENTVYTVLRRTYCMTENMAVDTENTLFIPPLKSKAILRLAFYSLYLK